MDRAAALLHLLADGQCHSGEELGARLGVSRVAVWKLVGRLRREGIRILADIGAGYRLPGPVRLLDARTITGNLAESVRPLFPSIETVLVTESTNSSLLAGAASADSPRVLLAEQQTGGRGRRGRTWQSPFGGGLFLSLLWPFQQLRAGLSGLSLVTGLAVGDALRAVAGVEVRLKWPNDVVAGGGKLAGILIEMVGEPQGPCRVVIGIGVNSHVPDTVVDGIDQPWTDLQRLTGQSMDRNRLAAAILERLAEAMPVFATEGFAPFHAAWKAVDALDGRRVTLSLGGEMRPGLARGVDNAGHLLVEEPGGVQAWAGGEVSVREQPA